MQASFILNSSSQQMRSMHLDASYLDLITLEMNTKSIERFCLRTSLAHQHLEMRWEKMVLPTKYMIEVLKQKYKPGLRVRLTSMKDIQAPPIGTLGTVIGVDDVGTIHVAWDTGSTLGVVYGEDTCILV